MLDDDRLENDIRTIADSGNWLKDNYQKQPKRLVLQELRYMAQTIRNTLARLVD